MEQQLIAYYEELYAFYDAYRVLTARLVEVTSTEDTPEAQRILDLRQETIARTNRHINQNQALVRLWREAGGEQNPPQSLRDLFEKIRVCLEELNHQEEQLRESFGEQLDSLKQQRKQLTKARRAVNGYKSQEQKPDPRFMKTKG